jgi:hypothetical protein
MMLNSLFFLGTVLGEKFWQLTEHINRLEPFPRRVWTVLFVFTLKDSTGTTALSASVTIQSCKHCYIVYLCRSYIPSAICNSQYYLRVRASGCNTSSLSVSPFHRCRCCHRFFWFDSYRLKWSCRSRDMPYAQNVEKRVCIASLIYVYLHWLLLRSQVQHIVIAPSVAVPVSKCVNRVPVDLQTKRCRKRLDSQRECSRWREIWRPTEWPVYRV